MLYFIFTLNFGNLYLYPLLFWISIILALPTSILNSNLINVQRFLADNDPFLSTSLRVYSTCSSSIFLGDLLWFFCCLQEILQISYNDQRRFCIFFQTMKVSELCIFEKYYSILIIVKIIIKMFCCLLYSCMEMLSSLCSSASSTSISEQESLY